MRGRDPPPPVPPPGLGDLFGAFLYAQVALRAEHAELMAERALLEEAKAKLMAERQEVTTLGE